MEMSSEIPKREQAIGIRRRDPPATPEAPHAERAARRLRMMAVGISTWIPRVKSSCHCHNGDGDSSSVHVDGCTKRNGYGIGVTVEPHLFTDFHIDWDIGCRTSCEKSSQSTSLQTVEDQRIWILADAPVNQKRVCYKIDKKHAAYQQQQ